MAFENWSFGKPTKGLPWPNDENGKPIEPAFLVHLSAVDLEGQIVISMLESEGIPVVTQYPNGGSFGRVIIGISGTGIDLYVPITRLEDAIGMLEGEIAEDGYEEDDLV
ncbi:MAG: hypothetical protein FWE12_05440 [Oscillospiraceae bacterium]|nr:hypothetical protein [Oscillospiraceae bacterium]